MDAAVKSDTFTARPVDSGKRLTGSFLYLKEEGLRELLPPAVVGCGCVEPPCLGASGGRPDTFRRHICTLRIFVFWDQMHRGIYFFVIVLTH